MLNIAQFLRTDISLVLLFFCLLVDAWLFWNGLNYVKKKENKVTQESRNIGGLRRSCFFQDVAFFNMRYPIIHKKLSSKT